MKPFLLAAALMYTALSFAQKSDELTLPITYVSGFGSFDPAYGGLNFMEPPVDHPFYKAIKALQFKGIPSGLKNVKKGFIFIDAEQWVYQTYRSGNLSKETFEQVVAEQQMNLSFRSLTADSIACLVLIVKGTDEKGDEKLLVDYNNNGDFSDEEPVIVPQTAPLWKVDSLVRYSKNVKYQVGKTASKQIPLLIFKTGNNYMYCFSQYAVASFKQGSNTYKIAVSHGFVYPSFWTFQAGLCLSDKLDKNALVKRNEFLNVGNQFYSVTGVNVNTDMLLLKKAAVNGKNIESSQVGYRAIQFTGKDILSDKTIALGNYSGKYVFVDFWGSWCGPCLGEIPALKEIYAKMDSSKIDFVGVVGKDTLLNARKAIVEKEIPWPNVLSDKENLIVEKYHNLAYPKGLLIGPDGKIIATDLHSFTLKSKLKELGLLQ
ncbi:TlpA family protein disulfide reductase [Pinibacter aurantiacus]|uniref:TlpA family protein disulfide reductase n=1 Tax=Pinibacter aurantiacus TaxID=2851599 RepID=A0A9E2SA85_9BACT|nr:TlpA disulfide reductase family protein [Pinibacter aurantiacus]MBV4357509.1 TlpA family protein disulfide reductase [Pinibacter aurantiacus]